MVKMITPSTPLTQLRITAIIRPLDPIEAGATACVFESLDVPTVGCAKLALVGCGAGVAPPAFWLDACETEVAVAVAALVG